MFPKQKTNSLPFFWHLLYNSLKFQFLNVSKFYMPEI